jgi:hypothetical protein
MYLIPPVGITDPNDVQVVAALTQSILQVKGAGSSGVVAAMSYDPDYYAGGGRASEGHRNAQDWHVEQGQRGVGREQRESDQEGNGGDQEGDGVAKKKEEKKKGYEGEVHKKNKSSRRRASRAQRLVQHLHFVGLTISMGAPTFLELYEVPYRGDSDWTIHRGGGVFLEGIAHSSVTDCTISMVGSNAVFVSNAAYNITIARNEISQVGASAVAAP